MFRVLEGGVFVDRVYVRDASIREDFNCWKQMPSAREYALAYDQQMYERNWASPKKETDRNKEIQE